MIHWNYAEDFSGREAAYLIAGLDPSLNSPEDTYRVQPIIKKLKAAYYLACAEISKDITQDETSEKSWGWLHDHKYDKAELLSVELESLLSNFNNSEFIKNGILAKAEEYDRRTFPKDQLEIELEKKLDELRTEKKSYSSKLDPEAYLEYETLCEEKRALERDHHDRNITWNQYFEKNREIEYRRGKKWEELDELVSQSYPAFNEQYSLVREKIADLTFERNDWDDANNKEKFEFLEGVWPIWGAAVREALIWKAADHHEFDDQRFSRYELGRWVLENDFKSEYQFAKIAEKKETPLGTRERNTLLKIIHALSKMQGLDLSKPYKAAEVVLDNVELLGHSMSLEIIARKLEEAKKS